METSELCEAARSVEEDDQMVKCELEAAEALAGLACCSVVRGCATCTAESESFRQKLVKEPAEQAIAVQQFCGNRSTLVTSAFNAEETVRIVPSQLCTSSYQSNSASKAEKEARRLRRVLANRESARQTIRRRQAMLLELTRKAADLSEENENLKKEKELAVEGYNSLRSRNEFLKLKMDNVRAAQLGEMQEELKSSLAEIASSAAISTPFFLYNQISSVPFFWPPILPSPDVLQLQRVSHSDLMSSLESHMQHRDIPSLHQGQETSLGITGPGNPLFVLPVPWLLPFLSPSSTLHSHSDARKRQNETSSTQQCSMSSSSRILFAKDNHQLSSNLNMKMESSTSTRTMSMGSIHGAGFKLPADTNDHHTTYHREAALLVPETSCIRPLENLQPSAEIDSLNAVSAPEHISQSILKKNQEPIINCHKKPEDVFAATDARMRRKELVKLKKTQVHHDHTHITSYGVS